MPFSTTSNSLTPTIALPYVLPSYSVVPHAVFAISTSEVYSIQHADQSADIYVDDVKVGTHWGGYNAFFSDITNYIHEGTNNIKVALCNTTRSVLAPCSGDFNYNATMGYVKLQTSPVMPDEFYGYDGFHITSVVAASAATVTVTTVIPAGADVICKIEDENYTYIEKQQSTGSGMTFTTTIQT